MIGAGLRDRHVVLPDVDAVGARGDREVRPVVDEQQRAGRRAERPGLGGRGQDLLVAGVLLAQLHEVDAAAQRGLQHLGQGAPAGAAPGDQVEACGVRSRSRRSEPSIAPF